METITVLNVGVNPPVEMTGRVKKYTDKGVVIEDARGVVHYAATERIVNKKAIKFADVLF